MDMVEVRVQVPALRETEFYRWFADWRDGVLTPEAGAHQEVAHADSPALSGAKVAGGAEAAIRWWKSLTSNERQLWGLWIDAAPSMVVADDIVAELGLKSPRDIPGILSWSGRKGRKFGFEVNWRFETDAVSGKPIYGIQDEGFAALLSEARDTAESSTSPPRIKKFDS